MDQLIPPLKTSGQGNLKKIYIKLLLKAVQHSLPSGEMNPGFSLEYTILFPSSKSVNNIVLFHSLSPKIIFLWGKLTHLKSLDMVYDDCPCLSRVSSHCRLGSRAPQEIMWQGSFPMLGGNGGTENGRTQVRLDNCPVGLIRCKVCTMQMIIASFS